MLAAMDLGAYVKTLSEPQRLALAAAAGTTWNQLRNMAFSGKACGPVLAAKMEQASGGIVRRWDLRPDDWHVIWPELLQVPGRPELPVAAQDEA